MAGSFSIENSGQNFPSRSLSVRPRSVSRMAQAAAARRPMNGPRWTGSAAGLPGVNARERRAYYARAASSKSHLLLALLALLLEEPGQQFGAGVGQDV